MHSTDLQLAVLRTCCFRIFKEDLSGQQTLLRQAELPGGAYTHSSLLHKLDKIFFPSIGQQYLKFLFTPEKNSILYKGTCKVTNVTQNLLNVSMHRGLAYILGFGSLADYTKGEPYFNVFFPPSLSLDHSYDLSRSVRNITVMVQYMFAEEQEIVSKELGASNLDFINSTDRFVVQFSSLLCPSKLLTLNRNTFDNAHFTLRNIFGDVISCDYAEIICYFYCKK